MSDIDQICDEFEQAWENGQQPKIEHFIGDIGVDSRQGLIRELLVVEWEQRRLLGMELNPQEYCQRFPELKGFVYAAFNDQQLIETLVQNDENQSTESGPWNGGRLALDGKLDELKLHAVGGLGEVYIANDKDLKRRVAVKRIKPGFSDDAESTRRFRLEAEITGRLEHPGIVPVHGIGRDEQGEAFYVMKFIRGETLESLIKNFHQRAEKSKRPFRSLEFRKLLGYFVDTCQTIAYAHSRGVIHRDIKPSNIMIGRYAETIVVDWGLARIIGELESDESDQSALESVAFAVNNANSSKTAIGQAIGTPVFMSPEQASGYQDRVDQRSDVYSLGATLFVILTGEHPFSGSLKRVIEDVCVGRFDLPRSKNREIPAALQAICLKAMQKQPHDRFQTVEDLANDIEAYLADQAVSAWNEPVTMRLQRFFRQQLHFVLAGMLVLAIAVGVLAANAYRSEQVAKGKIEDAKQKIDLAYANEKSARNLADLSADKASQISVLFAGLKLDGSPTGLLGSDFKDSDLTDAINQVRSSFANDPKIQARILDAIGDHYAMSGQIDKAEGPLFEALELRKKHPELAEGLASSYHHVAFLKWVQGYFKDAESYCVQAMSLRAERYGKDHEKTIASRVLYLMIVGNWYGEILDRRAILHAVAPSIKAWQDILEASNNKLSNEDRGSIYIIVSLLYAYARVSDKEANLKTRQFRQERALYYFNQGMNAFRDSKGFHPGRMVSKSVESKFADFLPLVDEESKLKALMEAIELSKYTFHANEDHPGNLVVQRLLLERVAHSRRSEKLMRDLRNRAKVVFRGQPREGSFDMQLGEILFHRGLSNEDPDKREEYFKKSWDLFSDAIKGWEKSIGKPGWQIGEAKKKMARIAISRSELLTAKLAPAELVTAELSTAENLYREALEAFNNDSIAGYEYFDHQARTSFAKLLARMGKTKEAESVIAERDRLRKKFLEQITSISDQIFETYEKALGSVD